MGFALVDLGYQLYTNGGRFECVNWFRVGGAAIGGGALGFARRGLARGPGFKVETFNGANDYMKRHGINPKRKQDDDYHHCLLQQNQGLGKYVPGGIKNQPWNLNPMGKGRHRFAHKYGLAFGASAWALEIGGGLAATFGGSGCECEAGM